MLATNKGAAPIATSYTHWPHLVFLSGQCLLDSSGNGVTNIGAILHAATATAAAADTF
jgi:hypothetical protein